MRYNVRVDICITKFLYEAQLYPFFQPMFCSLKTDKMKLRLISMILPFIVLLSPLLQAASLADGFVYYENGNYNQAFETWSTLAIQGDRQAQFSLGIMYFTGVGTVKDNNIAADWIFKAANQGFLDAQRVLSIFYTSGIGVKKNLMEGIQWHLKAAKQQRMSSMIGLGPLYYRGLRFDEDYPEALRSFHVTSLNGSMVGQYYIGKILLDGIGIEKNNSHSAKWFLLSAIQGFAPAQTVCGLLQLRGAGLPKNTIEATNWFKKAAVQGNRAAKKYLDLLTTKHTHNIEMDQLQKGYDAALDGDYKSALSIFLPLAKRGNTAAQYNTSILYLQGHGVAKNIIESEKWVRKSAEEGLPQAQSLLAGFYDDSAIGKQDQIEAAKWYRKAAEQGYGDAQLQLAFMLSTGNGLAQDEQEAKVFAEQAAAQDLPLAVQLVATFSSSKHKTVYKCNVDGEITFSQKPCKAGSKKIKIRLVTPSRDSIKSATSRAEKAKVMVKDASLERRILAETRLIKRTSRAVSNYSTKLYKELTILKQKLNSLRRASRYVNGKYRGDSIDSRKEIVNEEIDIVTNKYETLIKVAKEKLKTSRYKLYRLHDELQKHRIITRSDL